MTPTSLPASSSTTSSLPAKNDESTVKPTPPVSSNTSQRPTTSVLRPVSQSTGRTEVQHLSPRTNPDALETFPRSSILSKSTSPALSAVRSFKLLPPFEMDDNECSTRLKRSASLGDFKNGGETLPNAEEGDPSCTITSDSRRLSDSFTSTPIHARPSSTARVPPLVDKKGLLTADASRPQLSGGPSKPLHIRPPRRKSSGSLRSVSSSSPTTPRSPAYRPYPPSNPSSRRGSTVSQSSPLATSPPISRHYENPNVSELSLNDPSTASESSICSSPEIEMRGQLSEEEASLSPDTSDLVSTSTGPQAMVEDREDQGVRRDEAGTLRMAVGTENEISSLQSAGAKKVAATSYTADTSVDRNMLAADETAHSPPILLPTASSATFSPLDDAISETPHSPFRHSFDGLTLRQAVNELTKSPIVLGQVMPLDRHLTGEGRIRDGQGEQVEEELSMLLELKKQGSMADAELRRNDLVFVESAVPVVATQYRLAGGSRK